MKISYPINDQTWCEKEQDWSPEECEDKGGHCWIEYQSRVGLNDVFPPKQRTCKHCGLKQTLRVEHNEIWE